MKITIPGDPIPKARARLTKRGFAYDPQWDIKQRVISFLKKDFKEGHKLDKEEAYEVNWYFHMPIPKSFSQNKANACKWGLIEHTSKPDRSNLEKFYEDCANGILWNDDSQITKGEIIKKYCNDDKPRTEIYMKQIGKPNEETKNIISLFSPEEIYSIVEDAKSIGDNTNSLLSSPSNLPQIANFISKMADHSKKLSKINKNYPGHWKKFESNSSFIQY